MSDYKVSLRYAISLLGMANDKNNLDAVTKDMELIASTISANTKLKLMLESPVIKPKIKSSVLEEVFRGKINEDSLKFLLFVIEKNREQYIPGIIKKFLELRDQYAGIVNIHVKTAGEFTDAQKEQLRSKFESLLNKKIKFHFQLDESLIGGFVAKVDDTVYDASIRHQLEILKKQFVEGGTALN